MFAGLSAIAATAVAGGALPLAAQTDDLVVLRRYEIFKRGTIHSLDPATRGLVIVWEDLGRVKLKAADLSSTTRPWRYETTGLAAGLRVGQVVVASSGRRYRLHGRPDHAGDFGEGQGVGCPRRAG